ncbi:MAG TPA: alpha/beta fold hydrolase [Planctomycetaceae bacterium]|nr:alpha/beta fold hydrolase [Planctomycetaceae bacterium]
MMISAPVWQKFSLWPAIALAVSFGVLTTATPVSAQPKKKANYEDKVLTTKDGVRINITYFPSAAGKNAPVAILLHGKGGNRLAWHTGVGQIPGFAPALQTNDFAVVTVDLRGHGQNIASDGGAAAANKKSDTQKLTARDYQAMVVGDMEAVKKFLFEEHQKEMLNMNKLAIVATDFSTAVALNYTDLDWSKEPYDDASVPAQRTPRGQDVRALVLISPDGTVPGLATNQAVTRIRVLQMPVMIGVGNKDSLDRNAAKKLSELIAPKALDKPHVFFETYESKLRGLDLLNKNVGLEKQMYTFLDEHVKKSPGEWRNRKSPLND